MNPRSRDSARSPYAAQSPDASRPDPARVAYVLRALLLAGLAAATLLLIRRGVQEGGTLTVGAGDGAVLASALVAARPPARVVWSDAGGPGGRALWLLSPGPAVPALTIPVGAAPQLRVAPPVRPMAGRTAALSVELLGPAGGTAWVHWQDVLGAADSLRVAFGLDGRAAAGLRVRPARPGWHAWTVTAGHRPAGTANDSSAASAGGAPPRALAGADSVQVGAWVVPERPIRALALAGTPDWESRFALRALDEAGVEVDARFELGRVDIDAPVAGSEAPYVTPSGRTDVGAFAWDPDAYDLVLVLGGAPLFTVSAGSLVEFARRGGGVLMAPRPAEADEPRPAVGATAPAATPPARSSMVALMTSLGVADSLSTGPTLEVGGAPAWTLPAELSPLPPAPARAATLEVAGVEAARVVARAPDGAVVAAMRVVGRGRAAVLGLPETWRWRMEGGATDAHRAWWRAWAEWAASGARGPVLVSAPDRAVSVGSVVRARVEALDSNAVLPSSLRLERPDGAVEDLPLIVAATGHGDVRFLAEQPGPHRLSWADGETGVLVTETPPPPDPAERSLVALASGSSVVQGQPVPPSAGRAVGERAGQVDGRGAVDGRTEGAGQARAAVDTADELAADELAAHQLAADESGADPGVDERPWRGADPQGLPLALGALLTALTLAEWTVRRLRAGP